MSAALLELGEAFWDKLRAQDDGTLALTSPADPVAKSVARHERGGGRHTEAPEPCAA